MNDRVAIIGGSTVGRDHFPFPVMDVTDIYPTGDRTNRVLNLDIADVTRFFYLVRKWSVQVSYTWIEMPGSVSHSATISFVAEPLTYDSDLDVGNVEGTESTRESDLVKRRAGIGVAWRDSDGTFVSIADPPVDLITDYSSDNTPIADEEYTFHVSFSYGFLEWNPDTDAFTTSTSAELQGPWLDGAVAGGDGDFSAHVGGSSVGDMTIDGYTIPIYATPSNGTDSYLSVAAVDIYPSEYWPYATTSGEPVYDTSTGEQLRNPLS